MSESCEILVTEWKEGQIVAGEIIFQDGKLSFSATKGYEILMKNVMKDKTFVGEEVFDPAKDPKAWLRSLPSFYTGSIVRARLGESPRPRCLAGFANNIAGNPALHPVLCPISHHVFYA